MNQSNRARSVGRHLGRGGASTFPREKQGANPNAQGRGSAGDSGFRILGVIPARKGSKGVPKKNLRRLGGVPLILHAVRSALESRSLSDCLVSTDDAAMAAMARRAGVEAPFLRPAALAGDRSSLWSVVRHAVAFREKQRGSSFHAVVMLQPTSPLRTGRDIDDCVARFWSARAEVCATAFRSHDSPYFNMLECESPDRGLARPCTPFMRRHGRRQEAPPVYCLNGAVYVVERSFLERMRSQFDAKRYALSIMPRSRSVDIDTEEDFEWAEHCLKTRPSEPRP